MKYYAVIDTNVLVSAIMKNGSIPYAIIDLVFGEVITPLVSETIICEYREVLSRDKFKFDKRLVDNFIDKLCKNAVFLNAENITESFADESDKAFYEVVMEKKKTDEAYLVTGNLKHFPQKPFVVTPREMLDIIMNENLD